MPENRSRLHKNKIEEFAAWCVSQGWTREATKGEFEVLRLQKGRRRAIFYAKQNPTQHVTVQYGTESVLVSQWLRERDRQPKVTVSETFAGPSPENPDGFYQRRINGKVVEEVSGKVPSPYWHGKPPVVLMRPALPDGVPCYHPGCLNHITHPCEGCGRVGGRYPDGSR